MLADKRPVGAHGRTRAHIWGGGGMADTADLKSVGAKAPWGFESSALRDIASLCTQQAALLGMYKDVLPAGYKPWFAVFDTLLAYLRRLIGRRGL